MGLLVYFDYRSLSFLTAGWAFWITSFKDLWAALELLLSLRAFWVTSFKDLWTFCLASALDFSAFIYSALDFSAFAYSALDFSVFIYSSGLLRLKISGLL